MKGYIRLSLSPRSLNIAPQHVQAAMILKKDRKTHNKFLEVMKLILSKTPLRHMRIAITSGYIGSISLINDEENDTIIFVANEKMEFNTKDPLVIIADKYKQCPPHQIKIACTMSLSPPLKRPIWFAFYSNPNREVEGQMSNAPITKDPNRIGIKMQGNSISAVRQAFFQILDNDWRSDNHE